MSEIHSCNADVIKALESERDRLKATLDATVEQEVKLVKYIQELEPWKSRAEKLVEMLKILFNDVEMPSPLAKMAEKALSDYEHSAGNDSDNEKQVNGVNKPFRSSGDAEEVKG